MFRAIFNLTVSIFIILAAAASVLADQQEITVSAAMSLKKAFEEIGRLYEAEHKGVKVRFNFGASGDLARQIEAGAPIDVFAAASEREMADLESKGLVVPGTRKSFATNTVVLITPSGAKTPPRSFSDLAAPAVKRIAVGNPKTVPAGRYAEDILSSIKIDSAVKDRLIYAENVRQILDYVSRSEVDAGIVYSTDARGRSDLTVAAVAPEKSHKPVIYPAAVIKGSGNVKAGSEFIALLISAEGRRILGSYGFTAPR